MAVARRRTGERREPLTGATPSRGAAVEDDEADFPRRRKSPLAEIVRDDDDTPRRQRRGGYEPADDEDEQPREWITSKPLDQRRRTPAPAEDEDDEPEPHSRSRRRPAERVEEDDEATEHRVASVEGKRLRKFAPAEDEDEDSEPRARRQRKLREPEDDDEEPPRLRVEAKGRERSPARDDDEAGETQPAKRRPARRKARGGRGGGRKGRPLLRRLLYWLLVLALWAGIGTAGYVTWIWFRLPAIHTLEIPKRPPTVHLVGINGKPYATRGEMAGTSIPLREMPPHLSKAFIAIEDRRFYSHNGIDPLGLVRALSANLLHRSVSQGGSTITQQLAKNLFLTQERTITRKVEEIFLALWLEHKFNKTQILELYLNRIYFGAGAYGVEAAAQRYFGKSARQVTLAESALLAGLVKSPSRLAPTHNYKGAERRAQLALAAMASAGFINDQSAKVAMINPPVIAKSAGGSAHYVADWVMDVLNDLIGRVEDDIIVETSIDPALQAAAEKALVDELSQKGEKFGVEQGALVAMTPDGAVRALVGGRNYEESQFNRAVTAKRQPGSAFKPFVYLTAIERGMTPDTVREDKPIALKGWRPENYNREYFGAVTLRQALAMSLNTVSIRLTLEVGPQAVVRTAYRLGIASKLEPNASIALGTSEVSVLELVSAYVPLANGGMAVIPHVVERVRTLEGRTLYARAPASLGRVIDPRHVAMMNTMMRETLLTGTARKAELPGWPAAGKTGTSQDFRDAWFIGYTSHLVAGVWLGNDDSSPTRKTTGGGLPVDVWSRFMKAAHQGVPVADLSYGRGDALPTASVRESSSGGSARAPQAIDSGVDGWFIDRLFSRR
jgi:penicillin-binding protein 1A